MPRTVHAGSFFSTRQRAREAIRAVGPRREKVMEYLGKK
ncbi:MULTISPECIES: DUF3606 domain-containing protein [Sinorhizobium]|nr:MULTISPECIES: DUF3606 domain-containing protein [Sinorhizobium]PDT51253.1 DUF3606 domain-containing protein [Sinorhizobium sp. NG07B]